MKKTAVFALLAGIILTFPAHGQQRLKRNGEGFLGKQAYRQDDIPNREQGLMGLITARTPRKNDPNHMDKMTELQAAISNKQPPVVRPEYPLPDLPLADAKACSANLQKWLLQDKSPGYTTLEGLYATSGLCSLGTINGGKPFPARLLNEMAQQK